MQLDIIATTSLKVSGFLINGQQFTHFIMLYIDLDIPYAFYLFCFTCKMLFSYFLLHGIFIRPKLAFI